MIMMIMRCEGRYWSLVRTGEIRNRNEIDDQEQDFTPEPEGKNQWMVMDGGWLS
jgi:hypothetical protein